MMLAEVLAPRRRRTRGRRGRWTANLLLTGIDTLLVRIVAAAARPRSPAAPAGGHAGRAPRASLDPPRGAGLELRLQRPLVGSPVPHLPRRAGRWPRGDGDRRGGAARPRVDPRPPAPAAAI